MVAGRTRQWYDGEAKKRPRAAGGHRKGAKAKSLVENLPQAIDAGKSRDQAAQLFKVSGKMVDHATWNTPRPRPRPPGPVRFRTFG
jgi:hypothetical protein